MSEFIYLARAAKLLADKTKDPSSADDTMQFIIDSAEGRIPVYWHNSEQKFSALLGFSKKVDERPMAVRWMQVSFTDLSRLLRAETIETSVFNPTSDDLEHLEAVGGEDADRVITEKGGATVSRDQLGVCRRDVLELAASHCKDEPPGATPTETPAPAVAEAQLQAGAVVEAPASEPPKRRRTWWSVASPYVVEMMRAGQYTTAKQLFNELEKTAGPNSPFDKGEGAQRGSLFVRDIDRALALKTLRNRWPELVAAAHR